MSKFKSVKITKGGEALTERINGSVENLKEWALRYANIGLAVFPIKERGKAPATMHGSKDATTDAAQIESWWNANPHYNIAIATGSVSGGLVVIDLDIDEEKGKNGYEVLKAWQREHGELPETCQSITGRGGYHLFYRDSAFHHNAQGLYEGVDIRGEGGYVVAPPSIHPNGHTYEWEQEPGEYEIAEVNHLVTEFLWETTPEKKQSFHMPDTIPEGERTRSLISLIGNQKSKGMLDESIRAAVQVENAMRCVPPLTDKELEQQVFPALKRGWEATRPYTVCNDGKAQQLKQKETVTLVCLSDVEEEEITWLYCPYIPRGKLTLCAAYPGVGKTYLLCYMAACVTTGRHFFNVVPFQNHKPGNVIYLTAEDGIGDTIKKRMRECGADMKHVFVVNENKTQILFDSPKIEEFIKQVSPTLMIFDPFQAYIGKDIDMNAPNKTNERVGHIVDLAEKYGVAVVLICHFNKNQKGDAITRVLGSTDIVGKCRSYIALGNVPGEDDIKFMSHEKSSLERRGSTILFEIDPENGGIVYKGENNLSMDDYTAIRNKKRVKDAPALETAKQFIIDQMPEGRRSAKEIKTLAAANHISDGSLQRAREELGIIIQKTKEFPPKSIWILPGHEEEPEQMELNL